MKTLTKLKQELCKEEPDLAGLIAAEVERLKISESLKTARKAAGMTQEQVGPAACTLTAPTSHSSRENRRMSPSPHWSNTPPRLAETSLSRSMPNATWLLPESLLNIKRKRKSVSGKLRIIARYIRLT